LSFGYCDFSAQSHFQALSRENRYKASWPSHTYQEGLLGSSSSSASRSNSKRMTWSPAAARTESEDMVASCKSKRMAWAAAGSAALSKRTSWLPSSSSSSASPNRYTSPPQAPTKRIPATRETSSNKTNNSNKWDKSRRTSMINGCIERVKSLGKKNKRNHKNYWQLDDASTRTISAS
ncbi:hypothetical protein TMatcc_002220, partial [Talaromyces marneffei ATCC 18224]